MKIRIKHKKKKKWRKDIRSRAEKGRENGGICLI